MSKAEKAFHDLSEQAKEKLADKFLSRLIKPNGDDGCWEWRSSINPVTGYGLTNVSGNTITSHRLAWLIAEGSIPGGLCVLHRCDNKICSRRSHLFIGTKKDNCWDMISKGRAPVTMTRNDSCPNGHPRTPENTYTYPNGKQRQCIPCRQKHMKEYMKTWVPPAKRQLLASALSSPPPDPLCHDLADVPVTVIR